MPGDYHYIGDQEIVVTVYWGQVSLVDILDTISRRVHDSDLHDAKGNVIDLSDATWAETPPQYVHEELNRLRPAFAPPKVPTVFVTPGEFFYGFARMYAIVHVVYGAAKVEVVRSWGEAAKVLGRDLREAETWARRRVSSGSGEKTAAVRPLR